MATFNSAQFTKYNAGDAVNVNEWGGRVRLAYFNVAAITGLAQNDLVNLCKIPKGARIIGGRLDHGAYGASVTLDIGISGSENKYLSAADISSAGQKDIANTLALNLGSVTTAEESVQAKFEAANPSDTAVLNGYILYVLD